jgi:glucose-6-phosphate isomerase
MSTTTVTPWILKCTDVPQFDALQAAAEEFQGDDKLHLRNLCSDSARSAGLTAVHMTEGFRKIILDYSRQQVTGETMELLFDLADAVGFTERREAFRKGERINTTEDRAVLHHLLRMPKGYDFSGYAVHSLADKILQDIHQVRDKILHFTEKIRDGTHVGVTGKPLTNTLVVGAPGWHLGVEFVLEALAADQAASDAARGRSLHMLSNVDPVDFFLKTSSLDPETTLVVIISKDISEVNISIKLVRDWMAKRLGSDRIRMDQIVATHFAAVTNSVSQCVTFGIPSSNIFLIWDWVVGRFSISR